jgi:hypothetical protein
MRSVRLTCHPSTRTERVRGIEVRVDREEDGTLALGFRLDGDLAGLRMPPPRPPGVADRLWQHTCFEAFVALEGAARYHELNFAPSGEWAAYAFRAYREGGPLENGSLAPRIAVRSAPDRLELDARVALGHLSPAHAAAALGLGLAAVVEETDGTLSYWSLHHPAGRPDFHHRDAFALRLEPPGRER